MRRVIIPVLLVAAAIVMWLVWQQRQEQPLVVSGFIEAAQIRVGSRVGGRVAEVLVEEGSQVQMGEVLFRMEPFDLEARLAQARAQVEASRAELARLSAGYREQEVTQARASRDRLAAVLQELEEGPRPQEIAIAAQRLDVARANLELARANHARLTRLGEQGTATASEVDEAIRGLRATTAQLRAAEQELELLQEGSRKEEISEARAALEEAEAALALREAGYRQEEIDRAAALLAAAEAEVASVEIQLRELVVHAPTDCVVEAIDLYPGDLVAAGAPTVALLDLSDLWVRTYVPEAHLGRVRLAARVPLVVDGFPGERFTGRVTYVATEAEFTPRNVQTPEERSRQVFRVKLTLEGDVARLRVGMLADVLLGEATGP